MSKVTRRRTGRLDHLRNALLAQVEAREGEQSGADLVREVALDEDVEASHVVAAMWTLVDDGRLKYEPGARLRLLATH